MPDTTTPAWEYTDPDGDDIAVDAPDKDGITTVAVSAVDSTTMVDLDRAAAVSLHIWLGAVLGQPQPADALRVELDYFRTEAAALRRQLNRANASVPAARAQEPDADRPDADRIAQAIGDPGSIVPRAGRDTDQPETITRWSTRAVLSVLAETPDGAARRGYDQAIAVLRGVAARTGSPAATWAADYLTADPDREGPRDTEETPS